MTLKGITEITKYHLNPFKLILVLQLSYKGYAKKIKDRFKYIIKDTLFDNRGCSVKTEVILR